MKMMNIKNDLISYSKLAPRVNDYTAIFFPSGPSSNLSLASQMIMQELYLKNRQIIISMQYHDQVKELLGF